MDVSAPTQLALLGDGAEPDATRPDATPHVAGGWLLDQATRERGFRGVAAARRALAEAAARHAAAEERAAA